jgi:hypothetical protein
MGLHLNINKCEAISSTGRVSHSVFQGFIQLTPSQADELGAPIQSGDAMDDVLHARCADLSRALTRLRLVTSHDALVLLRASFSATKILHMLQFAPFSGHPGLTPFDGLLREGIGAISNSDLTDLQWIQASLPINEGGLGVRRVASLATSAFLASAASTQDL